MKPKGIVFKGKKIKGFQMKNMFYIDIKEMYCTVNLKNILIRIVNCKNNSMEDKMEIQNILI